MSIFVVDCAKVCDRLQASVPEWWLTCRETFPRNNSNEILGLGLPGRRRRRERRRGREAGMEDRFRVGDGSCQGRDIARRRLPAGTSCSRGLPVENRG